MNGKYFNTNIIHPGVIELRGALWDDSFQRNSLEIMEYPTCLNKTASFLLVKMLLGNSTSWNQLP
jgi:hypothetical protein